MKQIDEKELKEAVCLQIGQQAATWLCVGLGISVLVVPSQTWAVVALSAILVIAGICLSITWFAQRKLVEHLMKCIGDEIDTNNMTLLSQLLMITTMPEKLMKKYSESLIGLFELIDVSDVLGKKNMENKEDFDSIIEMLQNGEAHLATASVVLEKISPPIIRTDKKMRIVKTRP